MPEQPKKQTPQHILSDREMEYLDTHPKALRGWSSRDAILRWILGFAFVLGLVAHVVGYLLKASVAGEPMGLLAELLYAFGFALWTGVVVTLFVEVLPDVKLRQTKRALAEYEEWKRTRVPTSQP